MIIRTQAVPHRYPPDIPYETRLACAVGTLVWVGPIGVLCITYTWPQSRTRWTEFYCMEPTYISSVQAQGWWCWEDLIDSRAEEFCEIDDTVSDPWALVEVQTIHQTRITEWREGLVRRDPELLKLLKLYLNITWRSL